MGYDLNFWAYADETVPRTPDDHLATYTQLCNGTGPVTLALLPVDGILAQLPSVLTGWTADGNSIERPGAAIMVTTTSVWVRADLYGKWTGDNANTLVDFMQTHGCPLYDPQIPPKGERFALK